MKTQLSVCPQVFTDDWWSQEVVLERRSRGARVHGHRLPQQISESTKVTDVTLSGSCVWRKVQFVTGRRNKSCVFQTKLRREKRDNRDIWHLVFNRKCCSWTGAALCGRSCVLRLKEPCCFIRRWNLTESETRGDDHTLRWWSHQKDPDDPMNKPNAFSKIVFTL